MVLSGQAFRPASQHKINKTFVNSSATGNFIKEEINRQSIKVSDHGGVVSSMSTGVQETELGKQSQTKEAMFNTINKDIVISIDHTLKSSPAQRHNGFKVRPKTSTGGGFRTT
jgi:hypothetical protein